MGHQKSKPKKTSHATKYKTKKHNRSATIRKKLRARQEKASQRKQSSQNKDSHGKKEKSSKEKSSKDGKDKKTNNVPLENGSYIRNGKPYGRPTLTGKKKLEFEREVYNRQAKDGVLIDRNTKQLIHWKLGLTPKRKGRFRTSTG
ncbi:hypothetical protein T1I15_06080 [Lactiplantibacillus plantarum]|nr:hypothetical protein T1I15_06080 [Lactiplantibacillus plantarum]